MEPITATSSMRFLANAVASVYEFTFVKTIGALVYIAYAFSFDPTQEAGLKAMLVLILMDFITGISAAKKTGEEIKSSGIFRSALKILLYYMMVSAAHLTEMAVPVLKTFIDETMIAFLCLTELISILENVGKIGFSVPQKLLNKLQGLRDNK